jgi:hypothetical protein
MLPEISRLDCAVIHVICDTWLLWSTGRVKCVFQPRLVATIFNGVKCGSK